MIVFFFKKLSYYHYHGVIGERNPLSTHQVNQNSAIHILADPYTQTVSLLPMLIHENWWNCVQPSAGKVFTGGHASEMLGKRLAQGKVFGSPLFNMWITPVSTFCGKLYAGLSTVIHSPCGAGRS